MDWIINNLKKVSCKNWITFGTTFCIGMLTHLFMLTNKFSLNDDNNCLFYLGISWTQGRWGLGILDVIMNRLGTSNFSMPMVNGTLTIVLISLATCIVNELLKIERIRTRMIVGAIMIVFPEVSAMLGFMFTSWPYALSLLLSVVAAFLITSEKHRYKLLGGIFMSFSCGLYQGFFATMICLIYLFYYLNREYSGRTIKEIFQSIIYVGLGFVEYVLITKSFLKIKGLSMTEGQNMDSWGIASVSEYIQRVKTAYTTFYKGGEVYSEPIVYRLHFAMLIVLVLLIVVSAIEIASKHDYKNLIYKTVLTILLPVPVYFHFIVGGAWIHTLMLYSSCMLLVLIAALTERIPKTIPNINSCKWSVVLRDIVTFLLILCIIAFYRYDNILYFKASVEHEANRSYLNRLVSRIQLVEGYDDSLPVCVVKKGDLLDESMTEIPQFDNYKYLPYWEQINNQDIFYYMSNWCGYTPEYVSSDKVTGTKEYKNMPCYPDDGSIKVINDIVVVKLSDDK